MKKLMLAAAFLAVTGVTVLHAKDHTYTGNKSVSLQDTVKKDTVVKDTTTTPKKDSTEKKQKNR